MSDKKEYDDSNSGSLWPEKKEGDYSGKQNIHGKPYKLVASKKVSQAGDEFIRVDAEGEDDSFDLALWKRDKKKEKSPDVGGKFTYDDEDYWMAGWIRKTKTGKTFMGLSVSCMSDFTSPSEGTESKKEEEDFSDIPF